MGIRFIPCVKWRDLFCEWTFEHTNTRVSCTATSPLCIKPFPVLRRHTVQLCIPPVLGANSRISHLQAGRVLRKAKLPDGEQKSMCSPSYRHLSLCLHVLDWPFLLSPCFPGYKTWSLAFPAVSRSLPASAVMRLSPPLPRSLWFVFLVF